MNHLAEISSWKSFGGELSVHEHDSVLLGCKMRFAIYTPPQATHQPVPVLWYLSGLTCTWANVMEKSGIQQYAARSGLMVIAPDTSPRGPDIADDPDYDLGQGAGFYLTATRQPWVRNYRMDRYITEELPALIAASIPAADLSRQGICGHSMGGHGAISLHLKHPERYQSCSAFAPITSPRRAPWGQKAFGAYLGPDTTLWEQYDSTCLVAAAQTRTRILVDTGSADPFLHDQLQPEEFISACRANGQLLDYRMQEGYGHDYYFVATFIDDHIRHHAGILHAR